MLHIVVVCTANQCRSPMAEAVLRRHLDQRGIAASVSSCGELEGGVPAAPGAVRAMGKVGIALEEHRSTQLSSERLDAADLILAMSRPNLRAVLLAAPDTFPRAFTLKELTSRAEAVGPRHADEPLADWLRFVHEGRSRADLLRDDRADDIADPIGGPDRDFERTALEIDGLVRELLSLAFPA